MIGKEVKFTPGAEVVRDESGAVYPPLPTDKFRLVVAPTYQQLEVEDFAASPGLQVSVQLLPGGVEDQHHLGLFSVQWSHTKLEANPLIVAYLDDIKMADELLLMRPFSQLLKKHGPEIGLFFGKRAKNYFYVPLPFRHLAASMYPDAVIVDADSPGDSPSDKLKEAAVGNALSAPENLSRLLITTCGVERLMGSPLRLVEREDGPAEVSKAWLRQQVAGMAEATASLFAHLGLDAVDEAASELGFDNYPEVVPRLPKADPQVQNFVARYTLARRLNHVTRVLPPTIIQEPLSRIEQMIAAVVAGLMRRKLPDLPRALRRRLTLPARWSGSMPGGLLAAPAQFISGSSGAEKLMLGVVEKMTRDGRAVPPILSSVVSRFGTRGLVQDELSFSETGLIASMAVVNVARAEPGFAHESLVNSRGAAGVAEEERVAAEEEEARRALQALQNFGGVVGGGAQEGGGVQVAPEEAAGPAFTFLTLANVHDEATSARALSEAIYKREVSDIAAASSPSEAHRIAAGLSKCAASFLCAVPMVKSFIINEGTFTRSLQRFNGIAPVQTPHTHHCGARGERVLAASDWVHLNNCACLGGNIRPHNAVRDTLAHAIHQCGAASVVPHTEVPLDVPGGHWKADTIFMDDESGITYVIDVSIVNTDSATTLRRRGDFGAVEAALRACEAEKRALPIARQIQNDGSNKVFVPFVMSSAGGFGPDARKFLKFLYKSSRERNCWEIGSGQPQIQSTWNTLFASTYWDMRLSMACTAMSAEVVGRIIVRDFNLNLATDGSRQPLSDPNTPAYGNLGRGGGRGAF